MIEYEQWLEKEIEKIGDKFQEAYDNYQITGEKRYYSQHIKLDYQKQAFADALAKNKMKDEIEDQKERAVKNYVYRLLQAISTEKDADKIKNIIEKSIQFGI
jgi:diphthamide synthase subunit DPH2